MLVIQIHFLASLESTQGMLPEEFMLAKSDASVRGSFAKCDGGEVLLNVLRCQLTY